MTADLAGFRAAAHGTPITMTDLVLAVQGEFRKQGRIPRPSEFGPYASLVQDTPNRIK